MKRFKVIALAMSFCMVIFSCGTSQGNGALIGTGGGALLGAIVGKLAGNTAVGAAIGGAVGAATGAAIGKHMDKKKAELEAQLKAAQVESITDANGLTGIKVTFDSGILFATNKADLSASSKTELGKFANVLKSDVDCSVVVRGHTDASGSDAINNPLSVKRAESVANYLSSCGVANNQFKSVEGVGSTQPVADNATAEGKAKNRRVEVYLFASEAMIQKANAGQLN